MKTFLLLILFACITSQLSSGKHSIIEEVKKRRQERNEKIISCINEKGSENLKRIFNENKSQKLGIILRENKESVTHEDRNVFKECRRKVLLDLQLIKEPLTANK